jgi:hypothetical protein
MKTRLQRLFMPANGLSSILCYGLAVLVFMMSALPANAEDLMVNNTSDEVNGDVSSPGALKANPGPDGISLREAIEAANNVSGPHTIAISPSLAGQTLLLSAGLPPILRDGITMQGLRDTDSHPNFTIDASNTLGVVLEVYGSDITIMGFRFIKTPHNPGVINVGAGLPGLPSRINNLRIEGNVFDNTGIQYQPTDAIHAISLGGNPVGRDASVTNVAIIGNLIAGFGGDSDGIMAGAGGADCHIENLVITGNIISKTSFPIEIGSGSGPNSGVKGLRITSNTFMENLQGVTIPIGVGDSDTQLDDLMIEGNQFLDENISIAFQTSGTRNVIQNIFVANNFLHGGVHFRCEGTRNVIRNSVVAGNKHVGSDVFMTIYSVAPQGGNLVEDTEIVNNVMRHQMNITGGIITASENRVERVRIANNTVVSQGHGLQVLSDAEGAAGNFVSGVQVVNTIFQTASGDFVGEVSPGQVSHCITSAPGFSGLNGNFFADPLFIDSVHDDYHLQIDSPAINKGTSEGAPITDLENRERAGAPDIGAFEFDGASIARFSLTTVVTGDGTVIPNPTPKNYINSSSLFYNLGTEVTLKPIPAWGSYFAGWSGDDDCSDGAVLMNSNKTCVATFNSLPPRQLWNRGLALKRQRSN